MPVQLLADQNVDSVVVAGLGARPLQGFAQAGIKVYWAPKEQFPDVGSAVEALLQERLQLMQPEFACQGHGNCHGH